MSIEFAKQQIEKFKTMVEGVVFGSSPNGGLVWFEPTYHFDNKYNPYVKWKYGNAELTIYFADDFSAYEFTSNSKTFNLAQKGILKDSDWYITFLWEELFI